MNDENHNYTEDSSRQASQYIENGTKNGAKKIAKKVANKIGSMAKNVLKRGAKRAASQAFMVLKAVAAKIGIAGAVILAVVFIGMLTVKTSPRLEAFLNLKKMRSKASPLLAGRLGIFGIYYFNWLKHPTILIHQTQLQVKQGASLLLLQKQACVFS